MKYRVTHRTEYQYTDSVVRSVHVAHMRPRGLRHQELLKFSMDIKPSPHEHREGLDYFGNSVDWLFVEGSHDVLKIKTVSEVRVHPVAKLNEAGPDWEEASEVMLQDQSNAGLRVREFLGETSQTPRLPGLDRYARKSFKRRRNFTESLLDLTGRIHRDYQFDHTATTVSTPLEDVVRHKRGVCQDFAHLMIACLRSLRLPARYVSGYLRTQPPPGQPRLVGADASHAWVSTFVPGLGWIDVDPTNNRTTDQDYITVAWGRDYGEVSPIRGVLDGGGAHKLRISVDVCEMAGR